MTVPVGEGSKSNNGQPSIFAASSFAFGHKQGPNFFVEGDEEEISARCLQRVATAQCCESAPVFFAAAATKLSDSFVQELLAALAAALPDQALA